MERWRHFICTSLQIAFSLLWIVLLGTSAHASLLSIPAGAKASYELEPYVQWVIEQPGESFTETQVLALPDDRWQPSTGTLNLGVKDAVVWARFSMDVSETYHRDWSLHVETPHLSTIDIFELKQGSPISLYRSGLDRAFESREFSHHDYILHLQPIDRTTYLMRLAHDEWMRAPISLKQTNYLEEHLRLQLLLDGLLYGLMLGLIVFTLLMLVAGRDSVQLYFLGYIVSATLYMAGLDGYFTEYFWPSWVPWYGPVLHMFTLAILACGALFFNQSLQLKHWAPKLSLGLKAMAAVFAMMAPVAWLLPGNTMNHLEIWLTYPFAFLTITGSYLAIKRGDKSATILILGLVIQWFTIAIYVQETLGIIDLRNRGIDIIKVGTVVGSTIMALALAFRIRLMGEARRLAEIETENRAKYMTQVSHELRAPMSGILGIADMLEHTQSDHERGEHITSIRRAGNDLLMLVNDLLDEAKLRAGKLTMRQQDFNLRERLQDIVHLCKAGHRNPDVEIRLALAEDLPERVIGDQRRIAQVLINLVSNAAKFTHTGSITIEAKTAASDKGIRFSVVDTGIGIDKPSQTKLFDAFTQANEQIESTYGGFGLGLHICRELISEMGGTLQLASEIGKGATFSFTLPLSAVNNHPSASQTALTEEQYSLTALAAEDNEVNRKVLENFMRYEGHAINSFSSAEQLIEYWQSAPANVAADVVFLDINLPGMDGPAAARTILSIAADEARTAPCIIGISGNVSGEDEKQCLDAGMMMLVHKPLRLQKLQQVLAQVISVRAD